MWKPMQASQRAAMPRASAISSGVLQWVIDGVLMQRISGNAGVIA